MPGAVNRNKPEDVTGSDMVGTEPNARHFTRKIKQKRTYFFRDGNENPAPAKKNEALGGNHECHHVILASRVLRTHISGVQPDIFENCQALCEAFPEIKAAVIAQEIGPIGGLEHIHVALKGFSAMSANYVEWIFATRVIKTSNINCMVRPGTFKYNGSSIWESICAYVCKGKCVLYPIPVPMYVYGTVPYSFDDTDT